MLSHTRMGVPYEYTHMGHPIIRMGRYTHMGQNSYYIINIITYIMHLQYRSFAHLPHAGKRGVKPGD